MSTLVTALQDGKLTVPQLPKPTAFNVIKLSLNDRLNKYVIMNKHGKLLFEIDSYTFYNLHFVITIVKNVITNTQLKSIPGFLCTFSSSGLKQVVSFVYTYGLLFIIQFSNTYYY